MEAVRESWTDERMDDLKEQVVELNRHMDVRFESMETRFASLETRMDSRFEAVEARIDSSQRTMIQLLGIMFATIVGLISVQTVLFLALL